MGLHSKVPLIIFLIDKWNRLTPGPFSAWPLETPDNDSPSSRRLSWSVALKKYCPGSFFVFLSTSSQSLFIHPPLLLHKPGVLLGLASSFCPFPRHQVLFRSIPWRKITILLSMDSLDISSMTQHSFTNSYFDMFSKILNSNTSFFFLKSVTPASKLYLWHLLNLKLHANSFPCLCLSSNPSY
jgi:hypothetical protein